MRRNCVLVHGDANRASTRQRGQRTREEDGRLWPGSPRRRMAKLYLQHQGLFRGCGRQDRNCAGTATRMGGEYATATAQPIHSRPEGSKRVPMSPAASQCEAGAIRAAASSVARGGSGSCGRDVGRRRGEGMDNSGKTITARAARPWKRRRDPDNVGEVRPNGSDDGSERQAIE